jgi:acyl carrier protein
MPQQEFSITDLMDLLVRKVGLPSHERTDNPTATFADVGLDSLAFLQLQAELQETYGVELPDDRPNGYTMGDITAVVNQRLQERAA